LRKINFNSYNYANWRGGKEKILNLGLTFLSDQVHVYHWSKFISLMGLDSVFDQILIFLLKWI